MSNPIPDAHDTKFDRQMRLWGGHGQRLIEHCKICCIGSSATATESIKNLVLPNIGFVELIDDVLVAEKDIGNNFFLNDTDINQSRAEAVARNLTEMNQDCKIHATHLVNQSLSQYIDENMSKFDQYSAVLICQQPMTKSPYKLINHLYELNIPVIIARCFGLIASLRLIKKEHLIIESHPSNDRRDLFLHPKQLEHWPEYREFLESFKFIDKPVNQSTNQSMDESPSVDDTAPISVDDDGPVTHADESVSLSQTTIDQSTNQSISQFLNGDGTDSELHAHIPYVAILYEATQRWSKSTNQSINQSVNLPTTYETQQAFKQSVKNMSWDFGNETNFNEAYDCASRVYHLPTLDQSTLAVYKDPEASINQSNNQSVDPFWICVSAINAFVDSDGHGCLPVSIDLPDMHSKTEWYVKLKQIFKQKADRDLFSITKHVRNIEQSINQSVNPVSDAYINHFVKNCRTLRVIRTRSLAQEYGILDPSISQSISQSNEGQSNNQSINQSVDSHFANEINEILEEAAFESMDSETDPSINQSIILPHPPLYHWYLSLRACDLFYDKNGRFPGELLADEERLIDCSDESIECDTQWEKDGQQVHELSTQLCQSINQSIDQSINADLDCCMEMARSGACEPHVSAAYIGGVAAQEMLKIILHQYVPINHTLIYNGIHTEAKTFNF